MVGAAIDAGAVADLSAAAAEASVLLNAAEASTFRLVGVEGAQGLVDALAGKPIPTPISGPVCTAADEPISMDEAIERAIEHSGGGAPLSVSSSGGFQMISSTVDADGNVVTSISRFDINQNNAGVQKLGLHLNLETQINGATVRNGPLADPHTPINPTAIRPGDIP